MKKNLGIFLMFASMGLFYWGYHLSQQTEKHVAGLLKKDNGTRHIIYIDIAAICLLLVGGYMAMEEKS